MCGLKAAQIHGRPCRATKESVAVLYSLLPYGKKILICRHYHPCCVMMQLALGHLPRIT